MPGNSDGACGVRGAACTRCPDAATCGGGGKPGVCGASFVKYGNDGTTSCDAYCAGASWGSPGACIDASAFNVPCGQIVGTLVNGAEITCLCRNGSVVYEKHGNNGSTSCNAYCAGDSGGPAGTCMHAAIERVPCAQGLGKLTNGSDLQCTCSGLASCLGTACSTPANGFATCSAGVCSFTCAAGFLPCNAGCCAAPPTFLKYGNDGTMSCDAYCASNAAGASGVCVFAQALDVPCGQATGYFSNKASLSCTCASGGVTFDKPGNDGSASCDTYCAGAQWGPTGTCVHAAVIDVPCSQPLATGKLTNGSDVQCACR
jgi:hypothetical protein